MQNDGNNREYDVLVIGAGAAGLIAAWEIAAAGKSVAVIEASQHIGGRILTILDPAFDGPVALGAEFVHGDLPLTKSLLHKAGATLTPISGSIWQHRNGTLNQQEDFIEDYEVLEQKFTELEKDMPVGGFLQQHLQGEEWEDLRFSLHNYVEGYYAADTAKASTRALQEEFGREEETEFLINGSYQTLVHYLEQQCRSKGVQFFVGHLVRQLHWSRNQVTAITTQASIGASRALITVSVGVLQADTIRFAPALPHKLAAARKLGFGQVVKINLQFAKAFWKDQNNTGGKDLHNLLFLFSAEQVPTWWTHQPKSDGQLTGWLAGPKAALVKDKSKEQIVEQALASLSRIFAIEIAGMEQLLTGAQLHNWSADPLFRGAYSYEVVDGATHISTLLQPVENTLYFAGEGLHPGPEIGTVEAALASGKSVAQKLIASFVQ